MQHFVKKCNVELSKKLESHKADLSGMRTSERIRTAMQWRLEMLMPVMGERY